MSASSRSSCQGNRYAPCRPELLGCSSCILVPCEEWVHSGSTLHQRFWIDSEHVHLRSLNLIRFDWGLTDSSSRPCARMRWACKRCRVARKILTCWPRRLPAPVAPRTVSPAGPGGPQPQPPSRQWGRAHCHPLPLEPCWHCRQARPLQQMQRFELLRRSAVRPSRAVYCRGVLAAVAQPRCQALHDSAW